MASTPESDQPSRPRLRTARTTDEVAQMFDLEPAAFAQAIRRTWYSGFPQPGLLAPLGTRAKGEHLLKTLEQALALARQEQAAGATGAHLPLTLDHLHTNLALLLARYESQLYIWQRLSVTVARVMHEVVAGTHTASDLARGGLAYGTLTRYLSYRDIPSFTGAELDELTPYFGAMEPS